MNILSKESQKQAGHNLINALVAGLATGGIGAAGGYFLTKPQKEYETEEEFKKRRNINMLLGGTGGATAGMGTSIILDEFGDIADPSGKPPFFTKDNVAGRAGLVAGGTGAGYLVDRGVAQVALPMKIEKGLNRQMKAFAEQNELAANKFQVYNKRLGKFHAPQYVDGAVTGINATNVAPVNVWKFWESPGLGYKTLQINNKGFNNVLTKSWRGGKGALAGALLTAGAEVFQHYGPNWF